MHNSSNCKTCCGLPVGDSLTDREFAEFLGSCRTELGGEAGHLQTAHSRKAAVVPQSSGSHLAVRGTRIRHCTDRYVQFLIPVLALAWANDEFPPSAKEASARIQALHGTTGFGVFIQPGLAASASDADDFVALAVHTLDARGFVRCPSEDDGPTLFLSVHDVPPRAG